MSEPVSLEVVDSTALITVDNPPVNAASAAVRQGLVACVDQANADPAVDTLAIIGAGRTFTAGADIREFGKPPVDPMLGVVCSHIEASEKPVIAVVHGTTLGGGLEIALGCHARVGIAGVQLGFPEVSLGIIPGAGGTQRAPRLAGMAAAAEFIASGRRLPAQEALSLGLLDAIEDGEPRAVALASAEAVRNGSLKTRRIRDIAVENASDAIEAARAAVTKRAPLLIAPQK
ncbi:MAG: enoyl-CoA hydratase/isomerase family protein, partial [Pseudomonadota bacterium]